MTRWQIETVLEAQVLYEGTLSDLLLKMNYVREDVLLKFISRSDGLPVLNSSLLGKISPKMIELLPRDIVYQLRCIPVGIQKGRLVAVFSRSPSKDALLELQIFSGMEIRPALVNEASLVKAIQRYYAVRLSSLLLDNSSPILAIKTELEEEDLLDEKESKPGFLPFHKETYIGTPETTPSMMRKEEPTSPERIEEDSFIVTQQANEAVGESVDLEQETETPASPEVAQSEEEEHAFEPEETVEEDSIEEVEEEIEEVPIEVIDATDLEHELEFMQSRDEIVDKACSWLNEYFPSVMFFTVKRSQAQGFCGSGIDLDRELMKEITVSLNIESAFEHSATSRRVELVQCSEDSAAAMISDLLHIPSQPAMLVLPIEVSGKLVGLVAALGPLPEPPGDEAAAWEKVSRTISSAFESFILSRKVGV